MTCASYIALMAWHVLQTWDSLPTSFSCPCWFVWVRGGWEKQNLETYALKPICRNGYLSNLFGNVHGYLRFFIIMCLAYQHVYFTAKLLLLTQLVVLRDTQKQKGRTQAKPPKNKRAGNKCKGIGTQTCERIPKYLQVNAQVEWKVFVETQTCKSSEKHTYKNHVTVTWRRCDVDVTMTRRWRDGDVTWRWHDVTVTVTWLNARATTPRSTKHRGTFKKKGAYVIIQETCQNLKKGQRTIIETIQKNNTLCWNFPEMI